MPQPATVGSLAFRSIRAAAITRCSSPSRSLLLRGLHWKETGQSRNTYVTNSDHGIKKLSLNRPSHGSEEQTQAININSIEEFELLAEQGKADIPTARSFLEKSRRKLAESPLEKQREEAAKVGAGRLLSWLWKYREEGTRDADLDQGFCTALCWHLAAEGRDNFVWEWLKIEAARTEKRSDAMWNGRPLAGMVAAHLYWDRSLDGAIALFLTAGREFGEKIHLVAASVCITKAALVNRPESVLPCSPALFDALADAVKITYRGLHLFRQRAIMMLYHPTQADATLFLQWCKARNLCPEKYPTPTRDPAQKSDASMMARASYILRLHGQREDAEWLDANIQNIYSSWVKDWFTSWIYSKIRKDPRLKTLFDSSPNAGEVLEIIRLNSHFEKASREAKEVPGHSSVTATPELSMLASTRRPLIRTSRFNDASSTTRSRSFHASSFLWHTSRPASLIRKKESYGSVIPHRHEVRLAGPTSAEEFAALAEQGEASIHTAFIFLRHSKSAITALKLSTTEQRSKMADVKAGGKVLAWIWDHMDEATQHDNTDPQFADLLTWHLQGEGLDHFVWDWFTRIQQYSERDRWRGHLLAGLISASIEWESLDAALEKFYYTRRDSKTNPIPGGRAMGILDMALMRKDTQPCSPVLFELNINRRRYRSQRAFLWLYHPNMPDCNPLLDYLREDQDDFHQAMGRVKGSAVPYLLRAAYILRLQGRMRDADSVDRIVRSNKYYNPPYHHVVFNLGKDSRLKDLHEKSAFVKDAVAGITGL